MLGAVFHIRGIKVRSEINKARCAGEPVCSSRWGYYYSTDREDIARTVASMRHRVEAQNNAIEGLSSLIQ